MAKHFSNDAIRKNLELIKFVLPQGYGAGLPIYLKKGITVIENFTKLYVRTLQSFNINYDCYTADYLIPKEEISSLYQDINDYSNEIIEYKDNYLLPDALVQTLYQIKGILNSEKKTCSLLSISSLYRDKGNHLIPLYKDKNIFPVIQLDQSVTEDKLEENISTLKKIYKSFYSELGIHIAFLEAKEVPKYAQYELYFLAADENHYTKLGMIYDLSNQFKINLGLEDTTIHLVNSGFSGKSLFCSIKNYSESNNFFSLPYKCLDSVLYVGMNNSTPIKTITNLLNKKKLTYEVFNDTSKLFKKWKKSSALFYLLCHDCFTLYSKSGEVTQFYELEDVVEYMENQISILNKKSLLDSKKKLEKNILHLEKKLCVDCWGKDYYGLIHLEKESRCECCGKSINKSIFTADRNCRFY